MHAKYHDFRTEIWTVGTYAFMSIFGGTREHFQVDFNARWVFFEYEHLERDDQRLAVQYSWVIFDAKTLIGVLAIETRFKIVRRYVVIVGGIAVSIRAFSFVVVCMVGGFHSRAHTMDHRDAHVVAAYGGEIHINDGQLNPEVIDVIRDLNEYVQLLADRQMIQMGDGKAVDFTYCCAQFGRWDAGLKRVVFKIRYNFGFRNQHKLSAVWWFSGVGALITGIVDNDTPYDCGIVLVGQNRAVAVADVELGGEVRPLGMAAETRAHLF